MQRTRKIYEYPSRPSAMIPVPHKGNLPVPSATVDSESMSWARGIHGHLDEHDDEFGASASNCMSQLFSEPELFKFDVCSLYVHLFVLL